jgi:glycosyltransferase involved in cell wall biosynthesis
LDLEAFAPRERRSVRDLLGIPRDARVLLFLAEEISNRRKGFALLLEALARCARRVPNLLLLSLGQNKPQVSIETPWMHIGPVNNDRFLSTVYNAADLFAICSLQDNLPNTVLEAIACGIPVVGHAVGGIPDMVRNGLNGFIVPVGDADALADAICYVLNNENLRVQMGASARRIATEEYALHLQVRRYLELYGSLIEDQ